MVDVTSASVMVVAGDSATGLTLQVNMFGVWPRRRKRRTVLLRVTIARLILDYSTVLLRVTIAKFILDYSTVLLRVTIAKLILH